MAKKVLVSFLGTGKLEKNSSARQYVKTLYRFEDGREYASAFIAQALKDYYQVDKVILIGTVHSMWEEVYSSFVSDEQRDEDYYVKLGEYCAATTPKSELSIPDIGKLESAIGAGSHVVLTHYGINAEENEKNQQIILGLEELLDKGDELYVDITHAFRSLPLLLLNSLIYIQTVSQKKITIRHVCYGMFNSEMPYAPVISLDSLMETTSWIIGAYAFQEYGNAYKIADLLDKKDSSTGARLRRFSDLMNLNHLHGIKHQSDLRCLRNKADYSSKTAEMLIAPIVREFSREFNPDQKTYLFQFKLAVWHRDHHNYSSAFIVLQESIISYICYLANWDEDKIEARENAKLALYGRKSILKQLPPSLVEKSKALRSCYESINRTRNSIAHYLNTGKGPDQMIKALNNSIDQFKAVMEGSNS